MSIKLQTVDNMILKKDKPLTELQEFIKKFPRGKKSYGLTSSVNGEIIECKTDDKEILEYCKTLGFI